MDIKILASGSKGNAYYVSDGKTSLLLEAGIPFKQIQRGLGFKTSELAGVLISHEHADHIKAVKIMMGKTTAGIYMSKGTAEALNLTGHQLHIIEAGKQFRIGTWEILPFEAVHDAAEPLSFLLANQSGTRLLFATDTAYIKHRFKGLTHLIVETNYSIDILNRNVRDGYITSVAKRRIIQSHMSLETLVEMLKANDLRQVREIILGHLSDGNSDAEKFKATIKGITGKPTYIA